jgi:hypothetical protein
MKATDRFYDNTKLSAYKDCPRKYFLRHVMQWRGEGTAVPLVFGQSWHAAMDIVWKHANNLPQDDLIQGAMANFMETWSGEGFPEQLDMEQTQAFTPRTPSIAHEMLHHYTVERERLLKDCELIETEQPFAVPLPNLDRSWYVGRLDKVISYNGMHLVIEHKTTALYSKSSNFQSNYIEGWFSDSQVKGYQFGAGLYYPGLNQVWVDCALVHKTVHDAFRFVPVSHNFELVKEWLADTEQWVERVARDEQEFLRAGHLTPGCFPKNENSCYGKFGSCSFLDICRSTADIPKSMSVPPNYIVEEWSPFETLGLDKILDKE